LTKKLKKKEKRKCLVKEVLKKPMGRNPKKPHPRERFRKREERRNQEEKREHKNTRNINSPRQLYQRT